MFDPKTVSLGIAPIGWCNDDMPELGAENTFQQTVSEMALAGFTGCEIGNKYPTDCRVEEGSGPARYAHRQPLVFFLHPDPFHGGRGEGLHRQPGLPGASRKSHQRLRAELLHPGKVDVPSSPAATSMS